MKPPERFKRRVFPSWEPPADGWRSVTHHEAGHVVAAEFYGVMPHSAVVELHNGSGYAVLGRTPGDPTPLRIGKDCEDAALAMFGVVGLVDTSNTFEEMALRSAVILMAGQQAELVQAGIAPAGVLRLNDPDTRQARFLLRLVFNTDVALGWAQLQARYLLRQHWKRVEKISSKLRKKGCWHAQKSRKQTARKPVDRRARMIGTMLRKLEANPHMRYETLLDAEEYGEAVLMIRAAVVFVRGHMAAQHRTGKRARPPSSFIWHGQSYPLLFSNLGRVFIATKSGARLIGSGYDVI